MTSLLISLSPKGLLSIECPMPDGTSRSIPLLEGSAEAQIKRVLRAQRLDPRVGRERGPTYTYAMHLARHEEHSPGCEWCEMERGKAIWAGEIRKIPLGQKGEQMVIKSNSTVEELGL